MEPLASNLGNILPGLEYVTPANIESFFLSFIRISVLITMMPVIGYQGVDARVKVLFSVMLTLVVFPYATELSNLSDGTIAAFFAYALNEVIIGLVAGFLTMFVFYAFQYAGELMSLQMGLTMLSMMDPTTQVNLSALSRLKYIFLMLIFLMIGGHIFLVEAIKISFDVVPLGEVNFASFASVTRLVIDHTHEILEIGLKAGAPVVVTLFVIDCGLGIIARTVPQMNIFLVGFPLKILVGFIVFMIVLGYVTNLFIDTYGKLEGDIINVIRLLGGD